MSNPRETVTLAQCAKGKSAAKTFGVDASTGAAVKVADYDAGRSFFYEPRPIADLRAFFDLLAAELQYDGGRFIVRGDPHTAELRAATLHGRQGWIGSRKTVRKHGADGGLVEVPRRLFGIDVDSFDLPDGLDCVTDPAGAVRAFVSTCLPPEFAGAACCYQMSNSAGLTAPPTVLKVHLWFWCDRPVGSVDLKAWGAWWNHTRGAKIVDTALYTEVQPHYTANPILRPGLRDPLDGRRVGYLEGREAVALAIPAEAERLAVAKRAKSDAGKAAREAGIKAPVAIDADGLARAGQGAGGYLAMLGYGGAVRDYIRAAVGSYFRENGGHADPAPVLAMIREAVETSPWLEWDAPWRRGREHARTYLQPGASGRSNVDELVRDIAEAQRRQDEPRDSAPVMYPAFGISLGEAETRLAAIVSEFFDVVVPRERKERDELPVREAAWRMEHEAWRAGAAVADFAGASTDEVFASEGEPARPVYRPTQWGVNVTMGAGKTHKALAGVADAVKRGARGVVFAPTHQTLDELATRLRAMGVDAKVWRGTERPDPDAAGAGMCRFPALIEGIVRAGGKLAHACAVCEFNPRNGSAARVCGYMRQLHADADVWLLPSVMLKRPRPHAIAAPDFVVIDEGPWLALLEEDAIPAAEMAAPADERQALRAALVAVVAATAANEWISTSALRNAGLNADSAARAARLELRDKPAATVRDAVKALWHDPASLSHELAGAARRWRETARFAHVWGAVRAALASGADAVSELYVTAGGLRFTKVAPIHSGWRQAPTLYLDGTMCPPVARQWLPDLEVRGDIRVEAGEGVFRVQVVDSAFAKARLVEGATGSDKQDTTARNAVADLGRFVETLATYHGATSELPGLVITYMGAEAGLVRHLASRHCDGVAVAHFNNIRGLDAFRGAPFLVVAGRPEPSPSELERLAAAVFGRLPAKRAEGLLPETWQALRMPAGRRAAVPHRSHPDPDVAAVLYAIRDAELLQAIARCRDVRRTAADPVAVYILTNVCLDLTIHASVSADALLAGVTPPRLLVARGVYPETITGQAAVLSDLYSGGGATTDPAHKRKRADALRDRYRMAPSVAAENGEALRLLSCGETPIYKPIGESPQVAARARALVPYRVREAGNRQSQTVYVDVNRPLDARTALGAYFGEMDLCEPLNAPRRPRPVTKANRTPPAVPDAVDAASPRTETTPFPVAPPEAAPRTFTLREVAEACGVGPLWLSRRCADKRLRRLAPDERDAAILQSIVEKVGTVHFRQVVAALR